MKHLTLMLCAIFWIMLLACTSKTNDRNNLNTQASFPDSAKFNVDGLKVITTFINRKSGTMSTLYGNPLALENTIDSNEKIADGEMFALVTWKEQPDTHWFGANIPGDLETVEVLTTSSDAGTLKMNYQRYEGKAMIPLSDTLNRAERIRFILSQNPSIMP